MRRRPVETAIEVLLVFMLIISVCGCSISLITPAQTSALLTTAGTDAPAAHTTSIAEPESSGLLFWEATDPDGTGKLYLLGSIHVADSTIYPFPDIVMAAFEESGSLAVETDIIALESDLLALGEILKLMYYPDLSKISDYMPADLYNRAKQYLTNAGYYSVMLDYMKPIFWSNIIDEINTSKSGLFPEYGVDQFFLKLAKQNGTQIIEIESAYEQYQMLADLPDELAFLMIEEALDDPQEQIDSLLEMYNIWKNGDFEEFSEYILEEPAGLTEEELELYSNYYYKLLDERNEGMAEKAVALIESGNTCFYIVGAAHMAGSTGLINTLTELGYLVTQR
jgi:uncharacterized protein YbaP (TraB family)